MTTEERIRAANVAAKEKLKRIIARGELPETVDTAKYLELLTQELQAQMELEDLTLGLADLYREADKEAEKQKNLIAIGTSRTQPNLIKNLTILYNTTNIAACQ